MPPRRGDRNLMAKLKMLRKNTCPAIGPAGDGDARNQRPVRSWVR